MAMSFFINMTFFKYIVFYKNFQLRTIEYLCNQSYTFIAQLIIQGWQRAEPARRASRAGQDEPSRAKDFKLASRASERVGKEPPSEPRAERAEGQARHIL